MNAFPPKRLDPLALDLERSTLIEASAGTGKTYTITTLVVRLVSMGYSLESILVVTFTEAAAAELRLRIRDRIAGCLRAWPDGDDLSAFLSAGADSDLVKKRLALALASFDQASVMTIHSFCFSILRENAFESGAPFDMELLLDGPAFFTQTVMDFFGSKINNLDPLTLSFLAQKGAGPNYFEQIFRQAAGRPGLVIRPASGDLPEPPEDHANAYKKILDRIREMLNRDREEIIALIQNHQGVDKRSYSKRNLPFWLDKSQEALQATGLPIFDMSESGDPLFKFTRTRLASKTRSGSPPEHPFFDRCEDLLDIVTQLDQTLIRLKLEFPLFFDQALARMKETQGACFFDDLVNDLWIALSNGGGRGLAQAVQARFRACLIDEFQDTDPVQYRIFSQLFGAGRQMPFFMIGDPKQAIYAFRGGDIFAYMAAAAQAAQSFTLGVNYRSDPALVMGVNHLFTRHPSPFGYETIPFSRVATPEGAPDRIRCKGSSCPPLEMAFIPRDSLPLDRGGRIKKAAALARMPGILARDIVALLCSGERTLGADGKGRPVSPGDMAVLVRTNDQARVVYEALSGRGIPCFMSKSGSVFDSPQARELYDILCAVNQPGHTGLLKAALSGPLFSIGPELLWDEDPEGLARWQEQFANCRQLWETHGVTAMLNRLLHQENAGRYPGTGCTERGLANFFHLSELVSRAALQQGLSRPALLKWVEKQLVPDTRDAAEDELRLESDSAAVAIVTIHKSKGLEYPLVFLPYLWDGKSGTDPKGGVLFHDPEKGFQLTLDLGSPDFDLALDLASEEQRAEEMRLLYVALTRASAMCRIYWAGVSGVDKTALAGLIHSKGIGDDPGLLADLNDLVRGAGGSIGLISPAEADPRLVYRPQTKKGKELQPRGLNRTVQPLWRMTSYTGLVTAQPHLETVRDSDPEAADLLPVSSPENLQETVLLDAFPKGAGAGDFFHDLLEFMDFRDAGSAKLLAPELLDRYSLQGEALSDLACRAVSQILSVSLCAGSTEAFSLGDIAPGHCLKEMAFCFDIKAWHLDRMAALLEADPVLQPYAGRLRQMPPQQASGFLKGFIDLIVCRGNRWYILDYKSNYLGPVYQDYDQAAMAGAMVSHDYVLQYLLYLVALDRYLTLRLRDYDYETHFGGVFYLFLRGMTIGSDTGVYFHRPSSDFFSRFKGLI